MHELNLPGDASHSASVPHALETYSEAEQFRLLVDTVTDYAIFLLDTDGIVTSWNPGAARINGYKAEEIIGQHFSIFYTVEDVQRGHPLDELAMAIEDGRYEEEGWRVRKDGTRFWANIVITALKDKAGNLRGFGKVTRDDTERRRSELQLRRSEERFRLLVQGVRDYAILMLDTTGLITSWNEGAQLIKGYLAHEIIGKHFSIFYTDEDKQDGKPAMELAHAISHGTYEEEGWRVRKDGTQFWASVVITALRDTDGNLRGFAKVTRDITERKHAEDIKLQQLSDQISRAFLREVLFSVTEGRLRFCENDADLPSLLSEKTDEFAFGYSSLASVRRLAMEIALRLDYPSERFLDLITCVGEASMNAVVHAQSAVCRICWEPDGPIQVWVNDKGAGIELSLLHRATLERGFTTENSLGHGFWLMLRTCDRVWLQSSPEGSTIVIEQDKQISEPNWMNPQK